uniref:Predicted protein n=1 Tax=Physcomitrium patens TaxID=3218 RepID=A9U874_PHYPA
MVINVPLIVIFSLFLAVLLNQRFVGRAIARSIFFLPVILASGVIANLETSSLVQAINEQNAGGAVSGLGTSELTRIMVNSGVSDNIVAYLTSAVDRIYQIVSQSGVQILIFLAGIQSVSPQLYEASKIEGATGYEAFWKITLPMVSPLILVNVIYTVIDSFSRSEMTTLIRETGFTNFNFGLSSAMAWIYFLAIMNRRSVSSVDHRPFVVARKLEALAVDRRAAGPDGGTVVCHSVPHSSKDFNGHQRQERSVFADRRLYPGALFAGQFQKSHLDHGLLAHAVQYVYVIGHDDDPDGRVLRVCRLRFRAA